MKRIVLSLACLVQACAVPVEPVSDAADALASSIASRFRHDIDAWHLVPGLVDATKPPQSTGANQLCHTGRTCKIMVLGDSISDGAGIPDGHGGATNGYRPPLWHLLTQAGVSATFVGSLASGPDLVDNQPWPRNHDGHAGWSIDAVGSVMTGLQVIATDRVTNYQPDVVLLMVGTNDVQLMIDDGAAARLERLVDTIFAAKPDVTVLLSTILPTQDAAQNVRVDAFNAAVPGVVEREQAAGHHVELVDQHAAFVANPNFASQLLSDRLHPTDEGYLTMAGVWMSALGGVR